MTEFAVKAEDKQGYVNTLRRGFASREDAEDHPVQMSLWRRVWVEEIEPKPARVDTLPPFPWSVQWIGGNAYMVGADGRKFGVLLGTQKRRECVAEILCSLTAPPE